MTHQTVGAVVWRSGNAFSPERPKLLEYLPPVRADRFLSGLCCMRGMDRPTALIARYSAPRRRWNVQNNRWNRCRLCRTRFGGTRRYRYNNRADG